MDEELEKLADDHLRHLLANLSWDDFAKSIRGREARGLTAGETDSFKTQDGRWYDVSDSYKWVAEREGDIEVLVEVYWEPENEPAGRVWVIKRPSHISN